MKATLTTLFSVLLFFFSAQAQDTLSLKGRVIDRETKAPLPYARISLLYKNAAVVTNEDGYFHLFLNNSLNNDSVKVNYIGYELLQIPVSMFHATEPQLLEMVPKNLMLEEIVVKAGPFDIDEFMFQVVEQYNLNKRTSPYIAKAFFREKAKKNSEYVMFLESLGYVIQMDQASWTPMSNLKFFCENTRKSHFKADWASVKNTEVAIGGSNNLNAFRRFEISGPFSTKGFRYKLDSTYVDHNKMEVFVVEFKKNATKGRMHIYAGNFQIKTISFESKFLWSNYFDSLMKGTASINFTYYGDIPFLESVYSTFKKGEIEYWNELTVLIQKHQTFQLTEGEYGLINHYDRNPYVFYDPLEWSNYSLEPDGDISSVQKQLKFNGMDLEAQFVSNSEKVFNENLETYYDLASARKLIDNLKKVF